MHLDALRMFAKVAELASFSQAAEQLGVAKARVSVHIQRLESQVGTRLLQRSTRRVRLTPDGEQFLEACAGLLADADELQARFQRAPAALQGKLRIDLPTAIARMVVIPRLPEFLAAHPQVQVDLSTTDRRVDLIHEGFDCVLRIGVLHDSGLVARRLGTLRQINCASPEYLARRGVPRTLDDLDQHLLVHYSQTLGGSPVGFEVRDGDRITYRAMRGVVTVNNTDAYHAACLAGLGLIQAPALGLQELIERGELVEVLPAHTGDPMPVSLLYAHRRNPAKRLSAWLDWLAATMAPYLSAPQWQGSGLAMAHKVTFHASGRDSEA
jgi:DNA-binding transcriptional LysR family regulator